MIHVLQEDVRMDGWVESVEELCVEVLIEILGPDKLSSSGLSTSWVAKDPHVWVSIRGERFAGLVDASFELMLVGEIGSRECIECLVMLATFDQVVHFKNDIVLLALLFSFTAFLDLVRRARLVLG